MKDQALPWMSVKQRRLAMLVLAVLLLVELGVDESNPFQLPHALATGALTLAMIVLSLAGPAIPTRFRLPALAVASIGLSLLSRSTAVVPVAAYIVILDASQDVPLVIGAAVGSAVAAFWVVACIRFNPNWINTAFNLGFLVFAFLVLYGVQRLRQEQHRVQTLLAALEASRGREVEAAKVAERARLARDIHDVLAHSLTALIVQLDGARMLLQREAASGQAVESVQRARHLAQDGLDETRRAVGTLRGDRVPGPEMLDSLVADFERDSGVVCEYTVDGEPVELASEAQLTLYRTAQEALTNVCKHAPGNRVRMRLEYETTGAELTVEDTGALAPAAPSEGRGYGLEGMRERAELLGGSLEAGPNGHGFRVRLWLPA